MTFSAQAATVNLDRRKCNTKPSVFLMKPLMKACNLLSHFALVLIYINEQGNLFLPASFAYLTAQSQRTLFHWIDQINLDAERRALQSSNVDTFLHDLSYTLKN